MNFKKLIVWQKSMLLVQEIYSITKLFPKSETYGLASQMQRSGISIPSNIAEGYRRNHKNEYIHFLGIAIGSAAELETQILIAEKLYSDINCNVANGLVKEVQSMLFVMIRSLRNS